MVWTIGAIALGFLVFLASPTPWEDGSDDRLCRWEDGSDDRLCRMEYRLVSAAFHTKGGHAFEGDAFPSRR